MKKAIDAHEEGLYDNENENENASTNMDTSSNNTNPMLEQFRLRKSLNRAKDDDEKRKL